MFERFTEQARDVVVRAQEEARALGHGFIGTEHLLLGIVGGNGVGARVLADAGLDAGELRSEIAALVGRGPAGIDGDALAAIGIDLDRVREAVEAAFGEGALEARRPCGQIPFTARAKKVLELALREAKHLGHGYIGTEHILLGLVRAEGIAPELLGRRGLTPDRVRELVREALAAA
jgi:ATP-dependent Clp protease ATP-binding subunit ClpA